MSLPSITWLPSPYQNARDARYAIRGVVSHRIVGTLKGARGAFGVDPEGTPRRASTHFGIGFIGGRLTIDQYVDLSEMAWGNGDVRDPTWPLLIPGVNPNLYTVSIEHEDGGSANGGKVSEAVWQVSMELQKLITSGDVARIRAAGIRVRDASTVAQLAAIPKDETGFIDHHQLAGPNKPYCFRRWLEDPGFVEGAPSRRTRLLAHLKASEEDVALTGFVPIVNRRATIAKGAAARDRAAFDRNDYDAFLVAVEPNQRTRTAVAWVEGTALVANDGQVINPSTKWLLTDSDSHGAIFYHEQDVLDMEPIEATDGVPVDEVHAALLDMRKRTTEAYTAGGTASATAVQP